MPGEREDRVSQRARSGRDVNAPGRDQTVINAGDHAVINVGGAGAREPAVPELMPRDVPGFTGRDSELAQLAALAGGGRVVVSAIGGTAGVGKTALAVHAAHLLLPLFPDGHLYADLRGYTVGQDPAEPREVLEVFLRRLDVPAGEVPAGLEERSGLLRQLLASRRVLMVLDNARTEAQVRPLLPGVGGSLVLVTSRSVLPGLEANERISLDVLPPDEAAAMLARLIGPDRAAADPGAIAEVAGLCGRLPLALRIAGQLLATHLAWPVARLARMLTDEQDRLARLNAGDLQVRAAFEVSYRQLAKRNARLFRLLSLHPGPDFVAAAAAALGETKTKSAGAVLEQLAEAHLVTEDEAGRFRMHDLLRLFARITCRETDSKADRESAEARVVDYYADLTTVLESCLNPQLRQAAEQAGIRVPSMREALTIFQAERRNLLATFGLAVQRGWDERVQRLSVSMEDSLRVLRYVDDQLTIQEAGLAAARRTRDIPAESRALNGLGNAYQDLQQFEEAIDCYQQSLTIIRRTGDQRGEARPLNNLANVYRKLRRFEEAIDFYKKDIAICRETDDLYGERAALINLGVVYHQLRRFEEAIDCYQQSIAICRETDDRYGEGQTLTNLGVIYHELRRFEEAIDCHQQALTIMRETGDRHGEGMALGALGNDYRGMRQTSRAAVCWREAAAAMRDAGDLEQARLLEQQAASTRLRRRWWDLFRRSSF